MDCTEACPTIWPTSPITPTWSSPREEAVRLYQAGQSLAKLSDHFGVATDTVAAALRKAGITLRPRRGWDKTSTTF